MISVENSPWHANEIELVNHTHCSAINLEIEQSKLELLRSRHHRLALLYEHETRVYEAELREQGLAVIRNHL